MLVELSYDWVNGDEGHRTFEDRAGANMAATKLIASGNARRVVIADGQFEDHWTSDYGWDDTLCVICRSVFAFDRDTCESTCSCGRTI